MDGEARRGAKASFLVPRRGGAVVERCGVRQSARRGALFFDLLHAALNPTTMPPWLHATTGSSNRGLG
jgi:hypothetical protein